MTHKPRLGWIDALRHLLAIAVVFQHMPAVTRYPAELNRWIVDHAAAIDGAVAGFFLLSGYFSRPVWTFAQQWRQGVRLLMPYLLFGTLYGVALVALHRTSIADALLSLATGNGNAPQLYFLPYLWLVSLAVGLLLSGRGRWGTSAIVALLFLPYLLLPTATSTGSAPRLLALYALTYAIGAWRARAARSAETALLAAAAVAVCVLLPWRDRYVDLALVILLTEAAIQLSRRWPIARRLPGSGGVYLLHTPILNYALSILLMKLGVTGIANVLAALAATYVVALAVTLATIRIAPSRRWLLLE